MRRLFILECDGGEDRRLVIYRMVDQMRTYVDDTGTLNSYCQKRELCIWNTGRKPCGTGMELEVLV